MGTHKKGILGSFTGKVGTVVGYTCRGKQVMRSLPEVKKNRVPSEKQAIQHARFSLVQGFIMPFVGLLNITFKDYATSMTAFNNAAKYLLDTAVIGSYPNFTLDFPKCLLAKGPLKNAGAPTCSSTVTDTIGFTWADNSGYNNAVAGDKAILIAYCEEDRKAFYYLDGPVRSTGAASLVLHGLSGKTVHTWLSFISEKGEVATSDYTGAVLVA